MNSSINGFEVLKPGFLSTIQDKGRFGLMYLGISPAGVMCDKDFFWLNKLLDNDLNMAAIELNFGGLELRAHANTIIAVTGNDIDFRINQVIKPINCTHYIKKDDVLTFNMARDGLRFYIGVKGGFILDKPFNSHATLVKSRIGPFGGLALKKGDILNFHYQTNKINKDPYRQRLIPNRYLSQKKDKLILRLILGYQEQYFEKHCKDTLFSSTYTVSTLADRMGYRLKGAAIKHNQAPLISEGICYGAVQIPPDGQPIIMLKDRQSIGGYSKIGSVLSLDCFELANAKPQTKVAFKPIKIDEARRLLKDFYNFFYINSLA